MNKNLLIVSSHFSEDMNWLINQSDYDFVIYTKNKSMLANYSCQDKIIEIENKCKEVSSYLSYIINNYDNLPEFIAFIHGHFTSYHQTDNILNLLKDIKYIDFESLNRRDWRNIFHDDVLNEEPKGELREVQLYNWNFVKENYPDMGLNLPIPKKLICTACAQFVLSRKTILNNPLSEYLKLWDWMNRTNLDDYISSRVFEHLWHYILTHKEIEDI